MWLEIQYRKTIEPHVLCVYARLTFSARSLDAKISCWQKRRQEKKAKKENVRHFCFLQLIFEHDHDHHDFHLNDLIS